MSSCYPSTEVHWQNILPKLKYLCQEQILFASLCIIPFLSLTLLPITYHIQYTEVTLFNCGFGNTWPYWLLHLCQAFKWNYKVHSFFSVFSAFSLCFLITSLVPHNFYKHKKTTSRMTEGFNFLIFLVTEQHLYLHSSSLLLLLNPIANICQLSAQHKNCGKKAIMHATKQWRDQHWIESCKECLNLFK